MYGAMRRVLFALPPGAAHAVAMAGLGPVEYLAPVRAMVRRAFAVEHDPRIAVRTMGLDFTSPVGLAGGFDKNARRPRALAALGFGHVELGTVTARAQEANPEPNLFRLEADRALVNRLGFPNEGAAKVAARVARVKRRVGVPVGMSIGKSRVVKADDLDAVVADYVEALEAVRDAADFLVVNVSSPNTVGLRAMQAKEAARTLLGALAPRTAGKPLLVKIAPDLDDAALEAVVTAAMEAQLAGVVATNTTTARVGLASATGRIASAGPGGLSGPPLRDRAVDIVRRVRSMIGKQATVVGVGGVERAEHAMALVRAGADLVQMYTGFIYEGPGAPSTIARGLAAMVEREGAKSLSDLRG